MASHGVCGAEGRRDERYRGCDLRCPADVEASFEDLCRPRKISATEVGEAELQQPAVQREEMISRFCDAHGGLGVPNGVIEPADLGENVGEFATRECRRDAEHPEALVAQVALERNVPLEQSGRVPELAPGGVRRAEI